MGKSGFVADFELELMLAAAKDDDNYVDWRASKDNGSNSNGNAVEDNRAASRRTLVPERLSLAPLLHTSSAVVG